MDPGLEKFRGELLAAAQTFPPAQFTRAPAGKWCAAEVLEHLYLTYTGTAKGMSRVLEAGAPRVSPVSLRQRSRKFLLLGLGYLPSGRQAPAMARPKGLPGEKVLFEIGSKILDMDEIIRQCEQKFGAGTRLLDHPILGPLTGAQWRQFHCLHGRHHLKQIEKLKQKSTG